MKRVVAVLLACALGFGSGCARSSGGNSPPERGAIAASTTSSTSATSTSTTETTALATTVPSDRPPAGVVAPTKAPTTVAAAAPSCPAVPERAVPREDRPRYTLNVDVRTGEGVVNGEQRVRFTPDLDTDRLVFRLWANSPRITRAGGRIQVLASEPQGFEQPDATTLVLRRPFAAGNEVIVALTWRLTLPTSATEDRVARQGDAVRLGSFYPLLAWEPGVGWATEPPTSGFAEASTSVPSDVEATLSIPAGTSAMASGVEDRPGHWVATGVPDWAVSLGKFTRAAGSVDGIAVTVGVAEGIGESPQPYVDKLVRVLADFGRRFGPYPWPTYSLAVTPALSGGIEYASHVMQGPGAIGRTTSHEVGHMWFYALVATNQGRDPWIDEGMATWAEARYEGTLASIKSRSIPANGKNRLGQPMTYWESRQSSYFRSVYVQGAQALAALGDPDLVDCALRHLVARAAYQVTDSGEAIAALSAVFPDAATVLARYGAVA